MIEFIAQLAFWAFVMIVGIIIAAFRESRVKGWEAVRVFSFVLGIPAAIVAFAALWTMIIAPALFGASILASIATVLCGYAILRTLIHRFLY